MGSVDLGSDKPSGKKKGLKRPKRRISIRIDMTPMVDIAFLLLIFYMVSTIFSEPQAMEINLPPSK
jgi:biopolymer transport protein ExbD